MWISLSHFTSSVSKSYVPPAVLTGSAPLCVAEGVLGICLQSVIEHWWWRYTPWVLCLVGCRPYIFYFCHSSVWWFGKTGPVIGFIAGGYITQTIGIKNRFIIICQPLLLFIVHDHFYYPFTCMAICDVLLLRETYASIIHLCHAQKLSNLEALAHIPDLAHKQSDKWVFLWNNLKKMFVMLMRNFSFIFIYTWHCKCGLFALSHLCFSFYDILLLVSLGSFFSSPLISTAHNFPLF